MSEHDGVSTFESLEKRNSLWVVHLDLDGNVLDLLEGQLCGLPQSPHDDLRMNVVLHKRLAVPQNLSGQKHH